MIRWGRLATVFGALAAWALSGLRRPAPTEPSARERSLRIDVDEPAGRPLEPLDQPRLYPWDRPASHPYLGTFRAAEAAYGLPGGLLSRVALQESGFDPRAVSPAGARGLMQFMPATAGDFDLDPFDPHASIDAAGQYLRQLFERFGSWDMALAAYNWGQGNLQRKGYANAPSETKNYVESIRADVLSN